MTRSDTEPAPLLLEREDVLAGLEAALSRAHGGGGRVVLMQGPAGIGKTRLLGECRERAQALGLEVLTARGGPLERGYGFGVARQLFEAAVAGAPDNGRSELLAGAAVLAEPVFSAAAAPAEGADAPHSVLHGLYWLVANLAERSPLLLEIDDVHWADGPSLRFLLYLARRLEGMPVALVLALRSGEASAEPELLQALRLEAHPPVIEPRPLTARATHALAAARLGRDVPEDLGRACHAATGGNPFLLTELLHQLHDAPADVDPAAVEGMASERVAAAILLRVARVGTPATALVRAISVLGESADVEPAAQLAGIDQSAAAALADALAKAGVLEPPSQRLRLVHPLVRSAIYDDMPHADRALLHGRAAQLARDRGDPDGAAMHLLLSDPAGDAATVALLREAARTAMARGAPETAAELLRRAERETAPETAPAGLLLELGVAAARAGQPDGVALLREAFRQTTEQPARARVGLELAFALGVSRGESAAAIDVLESARERLENDELDKRIVARMAMLAVLVPSARSRLSDLLAEFRTAAQCAQTGDVLLGPFAADLLLAGAAAADVHRVAERALEGGELMRGDVTMEADFALGAVAALISAGALRAARRQVDDGIALARARGSRFALARLSAFRALACWRCGELATAESDAHLALSVEAAWGIPHAISIAALAGVSIERGDLDGARSALDGLDPDPAMLEVAFNQILHEARAALLLADGRPDEALMELQAYLQWEQGWAGTPILGPLAWRPLAVLAHLQRGESEEARSLAADELRLAREFGAAPQLGVALRTAALVEGADGMELLEQAIVVLDGSDARLEHARAVVEQGSLLRRLGQRRAATEALREGMDLADRCGATALVESAAQQLRLAGARPRRIATRGRESLTPGEHRVSKLAAQGMSNKQIAQALFVTLRTVEMHLSNAYRKLGIASRDQLATSLGAP